MTPDEVFDEIKKDLHYYEASGGGVTFSGGEYTRFADSGQTNEEMNALCAILGDKTKLKCYCI